MKKFLVLIIIGLISITAFARTVDNVNLSFAVLYDKANTDNSNIDFGLDLDIKKGVFNFQFDTFFDKSFSGIYLTTLFGGSPLIINSDNHLFYISVLGGINLDFKFKNFKNDLAVSPLVRLSLNWIAPFGLDVKGFADVGYRIGINKSSLNTFNVRAGIMIGYSFDIGSNNNNVNKDVELHPEYNSLYTEKQESKTISSSLPPLVVVNDGKIVEIDENKSFEKDDNFSKETSLLTQIDELKNRIETLEEEKEFYKNTSSVVYFTSENGIVENKKELFDNNEKENTISTVSKANFNGITNIYFYDKNKVFDIYISPLNITDLKLEEDEEVQENGIILSNTNCAKVEMIYGYEEDKSNLHILFQANNYGLSSSCLIYTNKRIYKFRLISDEKDFSQYAVEFKYPKKNNNTRSINSINIRNNNKLTENTDKVYLNTEDLNFNYDIKGNLSILPLRVYSDTEKTYIQFPNSFYRSVITPTLLLKNRITGERELVDFIVKGITYITPYIITEDYSFLLISENATCEITRSVK